MSDVDLLRALQQDEYVLNIAAASMYQIREPKGSKRTSFENLSPAKKARNRELAIYTLTAVFERYPDPSKVSNPNEVKVFLAEQMYKTLAPSKSESFPFDQRTPFARSYYQERAETFLRNFLLPFAEQQPRLSNDPLSLSTQHSSSDPSHISGRGPGRASALSEPPKPKPVPPAQQSREITSGESSRELSRGRHSIKNEPNTIDAQGAIRPFSQVENASASTSNKEGGPPIPQASSQSSPATVLGCLLLVVIVLLVILIARTF